MKLCVLAAGRGTRMADAINIAKPLIPLENKPVIDYCIYQYAQQFDELIVVLGKRHKYVERFLKAYYENVNITFVYVDNYAKGAGPGASLLAAKKHLKGHDFACVPCDSFYSTPMTYQGDVIRTVPRASIDWMAGCYDEINGEIFSGVFEVSAKTSKSFFKELARTNRRCRIDDIETKIANILKSMHAVFKVVEEEFTSWYDCGNPTAYEVAKSELELDLISIPKKNEIIYSPSGYNTPFIKYINQATKVKDLVERAKILSGCIASIHQIDPCFFTIESKLYTIEQSYTRSEKIFELLDNIVHSVPSNGVIDTPFINDCFLMYKDKTLERTKNLSQVFSTVEDMKSINGVPQLPINTIVQSIDWLKVVNEAVPSGFHGDFQPANILVTKDNSVTTIDHRDRFGSSLYIGDRYYDLSKFLHALVLRSDRAKNCSYYTPEDDELEIVLRSAEGDASPLFMLFDLQDYIKDNGLDFHRTEFLSILHYLNICSLYLETDPDAAEATYILGKYRMMRFLKRHPEYVTEANRELFRRV